MVFDLTHASIDMKSFKECDWREFCGNVSKPVPPNMPQARGKEVEICLHVDSDHAGDQLIRRLCTRSLCIPQLSAAHLVFKTKTDCGDFSIWCQVRCQEERNGNREGTQARALHDGVPN
jgi:hypothetical protein